MRSTLPTFDEVWQRQLRKRLLTQIDFFPKNSRFYLACSGGMDSMLLLYLLAALIPQRLSVISIDHQLQTASGEWCQAVAQHCRQLHIPCEIVAVTVGKGNVEDQARQARYQALLSRLQSDDVLVLAHHQQDQAETVLLHLLQGAGVGGLAAMPLWQQRRHNHQPYWLWRPLLSLSRTRIEQWTRQCSLSVVDDPMNHDTHYDRVWCRQELLPMLQQRFLQVQDSLSRCALLMQDAQEILHQVLMQDLATCQIDEQRLDIAQLSELSPARQRQLLSHWMQYRQPYRPAFAMVERLQNEVIAARDDAQSQLQCNHTVFTRFNGEVYRYTRAQWQQFFQPVYEQILNLSRQHNTQIALGTVRIVPADVGLSWDLLNEPLQLLPRQGGEKITLVGRKGQRILKKLLQDAKIAPWLRHQSQILLYHNTRLGVFTARGFWLADSAFVQQQGWLPQLTLQPQDGLDYGEKY